MQNTVCVVDRRRHEFRSFVAGVAEHDALVAGALILLLGSIDALRNVGRLTMEEDFDLGVLPMKAVLLVADIFNRLARRLLDLGWRDRFRSAILPRDHHAI